MTQRQENWLKGVTLGGFATVFMWVGSMQAQMGQVDRNRQKVEEIQKELYVKIDKIKDEITTIRVLMVRVDRGGNNND